MAISEKQFQTAMQVLRRGGIVAFPTETYYGLAVDPFNEQALVRLFSVKQRRPAKPVLTLVAGCSEISRLASGIPAQFLPLMDCFWPGPLTLLFPVHPGLPAQLTAGTATIGIRISSHPLAQRLAAACGGAITGTSANISGERPAEDAGEVLRQFGPAIDVVLDAGRTAGRGPSTIVGLEHGELRLVRAGVIPFAEILNQSKAVACGRAGNAPWGDA